MLVKLSIEAAKNSVELMTQLSYIKKAIRFPEKNFGLLGALKQINANFEKQGKFAETKDSGYE